MKNERLYAATISVFVALNVIDLFTTLALVSIKVVEEKNPIMGYFLTQGPLTFGAVKMLVAGACAYGFWRIRDRSTTAWLTLGVSTFGYVALISYQLYLINQLFQALAALVPQ